MLTDEILTPNMTMMLEMADDCDITSERMCLIRSVETMKRSLKEVYNSTIKDTQYMLVLVLIPNHVCINSNNRMLPIPLRTIRGILKDLEVRYVM